MTARAKFVIVLLGIVALGITGVVALREKANATAERSAHAALTAEICAKLAEVPSGQLYPTSLSELHLTFPDGGNASLLNRFKYHSSGQTAHYELVSAARRYYALSHEDRLNDRAAQ